MIRILHIFTNPHLTNGATVFEYRISEFLQNEDIYFDYLVTEQADEEEIKRYDKVGSRLYKLPIDNKHGLLVRELKINFQYYKFFRKHHYDVVYADTENALRAIHLLMAKLAGIPVRVVHSHNTGLQTESKSARRISRMLRHFFKLSITNYFACSDMAAEWLFPPDVYKKHRYKVLKNGIDLKKFAYNQHVRMNIRTLLGLKDEFVIGNVGRFMPQKNHAYMIEIFEEFLKIMPNAKLMLIGTGPLQDEIKANVYKKGMRDSVIFVGNVPNVNDYLQAMDLFLMPSLFEGLPITGIEAQASGLPCIFADTITKELAVTKLAYYCSLDDKPEKWIKLIEKLATIQRVDMSSEIIDAGYSISETVDYLKKFYTASVKCKRQNGG